MMFLLNDVIYEANTATALFFAIPVLFVGLTMFHYLLHKKLVKSGYTKALAWLVEPLDIQPIVRSKRFQPAESPPVVIKHKARFVFVQLGWRALFFILLAAIVFTAMLLAVIFHECGHGLWSILLGNGYTRIQIGIFYGFTYLKNPPFPFNSPQYYNFEMWTYIAGDLTAFIVGIVFMLFLLVPQIRKSFYASLFAFAVATACMVGGLHSWFGDSWNLAFGIQQTYSLKVLYSDTAGFLRFQGLLGMSITPEIIMSWMIPLMVLQQTVMIIIGGKLWRSFYPKHRFSHAWFLVVVELVWWYSFFSRGYLFILA